MEEIINTLKAQGLLFAHYAWSHAPSGDYGVWAEDGANDLSADDRHAEHVTRGTIDYFTRNDSGMPRTTIEAALDGKCAWYLNSIQIEEDTGYIHYEWVVEWLE